MTISAFMLPFLLMGMAEVFLFSLLHCWSSEAGDPICCSFGNGPVFFLNLLQWNHQFNSLDLRPLFSNNWYLISVHCPGMQTNNFFYYFCLVLNVRRNWNDPCIWSLILRSCHFHFWGGTTYIQSIIWWICSIIYWRFYLQSKEIWLGWW